MRVKEIKECFQVIITLGKDEKDALRSPAISYKYQDMNGDLNGEIFHLPDDIDIFNAVDEIIKRAQYVIKEVTVCKQSWEDSKERSRQ